MKLKLLIVLVQFSQSIRYSNNQANSHYISDFAQQVSYDQQDYKCLDEVDAYKIYQAYDPSNNGEIEFKSCLLGLFTLAEKRGLKPSEAVFKYVNDLIIK